LKLIKKTSFLAFLGKKNKKGLALKELKRHQGPMAGAGTQKLPQKFKTVVIY
jgi:hypothetical protein